MIAQKFYLNTKIVYICVNYMTIMIKCNLLIKN